MHGFRESSTGSMGAMTWLYFLTEKVVVELVYVVFLVLSVGCLIDKGEWFIN